jgi:proline iminopeptidase
MRRSIQMFSVLIFTLFLTCCAPSEDRKAVSELDYYKSAEQGIKMGGVQLIPVETPKGKFKVWTKRVGNNPRMKVLLLHGGPGATHEYWECAESFFPQERIEFIYYDQLGSAYSDQPKDNDLWVTERFVEEVEQVRTALGLSKDNFYLLGHSWGGILAIEYALKYQQHLKGLIISNMMSSAPAYGRYADEVLAKQMDPTVLKEIRAIEAKGDYQNPRYSEFGIAGRLARWDRSADLAKIAVPTLVIGAQHDTMDPEHMKWMSTQVQHGSYLYCSNGSHMCMYDDQETYMSGIIKFIKGVDEGKKKVD